MPSILSIAVIWLWIGCQLSAPSDGKLKPVGTAGELKKIGALPSALPENSGLIELGDGEYLGNNDSGDGPDLFAFNLKSPGKVRKVHITNAQHVDWEELASDEQYVYIGDTGNNDGNRRNLAVYRISKEEAKNKTQVSAEKITFSYDRQQTFKASGKNNFDCESLVSVGDSLYLFSKNRGNLKTDVYSIPNTPGNYTAKHRGQFNAGGLVTSADFRKKGLENELVLIGYVSKDHRYQAFLIYFPHVNGTNFFDSPSRRLDFNTSLQIEAVLFHDQGSVYVSNEQSKSNAGIVYQANLPKE